MKKRSKSELQAVDDILPVNEYHKCKCGCGQMVKRYLDYCPGHKPESEDEENRQL